MQLAGRVPHQIVNHWFENKKAAPKDGPKHEMFKKSAARGSMGALGVTAPDAEPAFDLIGPVWQPGGDSYNL
jgi:hypothetical protein